MYFAVTSSKAGEGLGVFHWGLFLRLKDRQVVFGRLTCRGKMGTTHGLRGFRVEFELAVWWA